MTGYIIIKLFMTDFYLLSTNSIAEATDFGVCQNVATLYSILSIPSQTFVGTGLYTCSAPAYQKWVVCENCNRTNLA